jgi:diaminohydroxyphosphoribosylaminopyrimidine deaminase/5-amino-6-(5-phosphoribosylamino)uracil reductase
MRGERPFFDEAFMDSALELAKKTRPSPNPRVGAVVVAGGKIAGRGFHERQGMPHAEVIAIEDAGAQSKGADLYVTLEPCCHHGKTGPCVEAIIKAGISRVAIGIIDPDPLVSGKGISYLKNAGIHVAVGIREEKCKQNLADYIVHRTKGRPLITLKAAITLDGYIATIKGDSKWISSVESRRMAHEMRADSDAVLVGVETVIKDDPQLTVRHCTGANPLRVVMDSTLRISTDSQLIAGAAGAPVVLAHTATARPERIELFSHFKGVETLRLKSTDNGLVDPSDLALTLGKRGILSMLVEGGSRIHGAFAMAGIADRVALFVAPKILGHGLPWISTVGAAALPEGLLLADIEVVTVANDLLIKGRFAPEQNADL